MAAAKRRNMQAIMPLLKYADARRAIEWLRRAFGFTERMVVLGPDGSVVHAQLQRGDAMVMLNSVRDDGYDLKSPLQLSGSSCVIYLVEPDVDSAFALATAAGAAVLQPPRTDEHGERNFQVRDLEGHVWSFSTYDPWRPG